jgi:hypothetical protein
MISAIVNLIIYIVVLGILYAVVVYAVDNLLPDPPARIIKVVCVVLLALVLVLMLINLLGGGGGLNLPKLAG